MNAHGFWGLKFKTLQKKEGGAGKSSGDTSTMVQNASHPPFMSKETILWVN